MGVGFFFNCHSSIPSYSRHLHRPNPIIQNSLSPSDQNQNQNHYEVLSVSTSATSQDIKKAFRLLARKYHPDVSKDLQGADAFKTIRRAYEVLTNEVTRAQYDRALKLQESNDTRYRGKWYYTPDFEERSKIYRWAELKQKIQYERYQKYKFETGSSHIDEDEREGSTDQVRSSFVEVLKSSLLSIFLLQTFGARLSLTFSSLVALLDRKLDAGYKIGYLIAWILGGRAGVLLTLCLSFASWVCGKSSSSVVAVVVVAMWVGTNLARYAPLPQGAVLTLLYLSIKLQADLN